MVDGYLPADTAPGHSDSPWALPWYGGANLDRPLSSVGTSPMPCFIQQFSRAVWRIPLRTVGRRASSLAWPQWPRCSSRALTHYEPGKAGSRPLAMPCCSH